MSKEMGPGGGLEAFSNGPMGKASVCVLHQVLLLLLVSHLVLGASFWNNQSCVCSRTEKNGETWAEVAGDDCPA